MNAAEQYVRVMVGDTMLTLHPLDFNDVGLTPDGVKLVRKGAQTLFGERMPSMQLEEFSLLQVMALFADLVCWEEESGRLFLCADFPGQCYCLPIPAECWRVLTRGQSIH